MKSMKKSVWLAACFVLVLPLVAVIFMSEAANAAGPNLIANASFETGSTLPSNWTKNKWGTNGATFVYAKTGGYQSSKYARVNMSQWQSGDAKWYFDPVAVQPGAAYTFSDYYKSGVPTRLWVASYDSANTATYFEVAANVPASSSAWRQASATFTAPANSAKLTVFHLIDRNGWLEMDAASLTANTAAPTLPNNGSVEQVSATNPALPAGWQQGGWGTNTPVYEYMNEGHTGSRSVKLTMSNYTDGDAKWMFDPITTLQKGKDYRFSAWYKTNTIPHVVVRTTKADGTDRYFGLPNPEPNGTGWQLYSDTFSVPSDAQSISVFFFLSNNGWVQTDDYTITPYTATSFTKPLVSLTFDDGFEENVTTVLPRLNAKGFKSTQCYATQYVSESQVPNVLAFKNSGHEVCSHTVTHPDLTTLSPIALTTELAQSKSFLEGIVGAGQVKNFASPYGAYNAAVNNEIDNYYRSHRTVDEGYNSKDSLKLYKVKVQNMQSTTTMAEFQSWLDKAKADKTWLVLVYHRVTAGTPGQFDTPETDFVQQLNALSASGLTVKTYDAALNELVPQL